MKENKCIYCDQEFDREEGKFHAYCEFLPFEISSKLVEIEEKIEILNERSLLNSRTY